MSGEINEMWKKAVKPASTPVLEKVEPKISFQKLTVNPIKNIKTVVHGQAKVGKTTFITTCPDPIYIILTEPGLEPLAKMCTDKEIYFINVYEPDFDGMFEVEPTKTLANIDAAVKQIRKMVQENPNSCRTVAIDSVSDVWRWVQEWMKTEILKIDKTARVKQQWDWGFANNKYQNIIMQLVSLPTNLVLTAQDKEEYAGPGQVSGTYAPRWQAQTPFWMDVVVGMGKFRDVKTGVVKFKSTIEEIRYPGEGMKPITGVTIDEMTYDKLVCLIDGGKNLVTTR